MLCLTRKVNESIVIDVNGELIEVKIYQISPKSVKVAITADKDVKIHRKEVVERIAVEDKESLNRIKKTF